MGSIVNLFLGEEPGLELLVTQMYSSFQGFQPEP